MIDSKDLKKVRKRLGALKYKAPDVISRAINRAAGNLKSNVVKKTREEYNIKAKTIRATIRVKRSTRSSMGAAVISEGNSEPITSYKTKLPSKGSDGRIQVSVKKGNVSELLHAFVIEQYDGRVHERLTDSRFPLKMVLGPAVPQIMNNPETRTFVEAEAWKMYEKRLTHEINRLLEARR